MRRIANAVSVVLLALIVISAIGAEPRRGPTVRPTTGPGSAPFTIELIEINGLVQVRSDADSPWRKPEVGERLVEGAGIRVGPRSSLMIQADNGQKMTTDRLGTFRVKREVFDAELTDVSWKKYGRTRYDIAAGGDVHESVIHSPSTSIRRGGLKVRIFSNEESPSVFRTFVITPIEIFFKTVFHFPI